jgi:uncharacterized protein (TIGR00369 family)
MAFHSKDGLKKLKNREGHNCFGCSPGNPRGLQMEFFSDGDHVISWVTVERDFCGYENLVHGGIISTICDEIISWTAVTLLKKLILTKSLSVDFLKPLFVDKKIKAVGTILEKKDKEVVIEGALYNEEGLLCAKATGRLALVDMEKLKKIGNVGEDSLRLIEKMMIPEG